MGIWLVIHPISQYQEDVKAIAKQRGLKILDAKFADLVNKEDLATDAPTLTKVGEVAEEKPKRTRKKAD